MGKGEFYFGDNMLNICLDIIVFIYWYFKYFFFKFVKLFFKREIGCIDFF